MTMFTLQPKNDIEVTVKTWDLGVINVDAMINATRENLAEAIATSLAEYPPELWVAPSEGDALTIDLCLPAFGDDSGEFMGPEFTFSIAKLIMSHAQDIETEGDSEDTDKLARIGKALHELAAEVDAYVGRCRKLDAQRPVG